MRLLIIALVLLGGCATPQLQVKEVWLPQASHFETGRTTGLRLRYKHDGRAIFVPAEVVNNLVTAKERLEPRSGLSVNLVIVDIDQLNAFATHHQGSPVVVFSLPFLRHLGSNRDAVASTMAHEMAHIHLKHSAAVRQERESNAAAAGTIAGTVMNAIVPFSGYVASMGITAYARSFTRDEERAADDLGMQWAIAAGFDPCGMVRAMKVYEKHSPAYVPLLSTHPSYTERSELAASAAGKSCE